MSLSAQSVARLGRLVTRVGEDIIVSDPIPLNALGTEPQGVPPVTETFRGFYAEQEGLRRSATGFVDHADVVYITQAALAAGLNINSIESRSRLTVRGDERSVREVRSWGGDPPAFFQVILDG